jgi:ketosteroid isomerase-like protein
LTLLIVTASGQTQANSPELPNGASTRDADSHLIQQIELDWLKAERTTDPTLVERVLADDYVNLTPTGTGPGKVALMKNFREHAGEAPPYSVRQQDMHIFVLNDISAVASYVTIYVSNENKNVGRQDTTHVFTKENGTWKLRVSRSSNSPRGD